MGVCAASPLPDYKLVQQLGFGYYGIVYKAVDVDNPDVVCAIKKFNRQFFSIPDSRERFRSKASALYMLNHPGIVRYYEIKINEDDACMRMEFVDGKTLDDLVREQRKLNSETAADIAVQVLSALDHAHSQGVLHTDLHPKNVMVQPDGLVKLVDVDLARIICEKNRAGTLTTVHSAFNYGNRYSAPEGSRDERSDIFSVGMLLEFMLMDKNLKIADKSFSAVIEKAVKRDRDDRYQSCVEMIFAIQNRHRSTVVDITDRLPKNNNVPGMINASNGISDARMILQETKKGRYCRDPYIGPTYEGIVKTVALFLSLIVSSNFIYVQYKKNLREIAKSKAAVVVSEPKKDIGFQEFYELLKKREAGMQSSAASSQNGAVPAAIVSAPMYTAAPAQQAFTPAALQQPAAQSYADYADDSADSTTYLSRFRQHKRRIMEPENRVKAGADEIVQTAKYDPVEEYRMAVYCMRKAIKLEPKNAEYHYLLGDFYNNHHFEAGWFDKADAELKKAIHIDPKNDAYHKKLGDLYMDCYERQDMSLVIREYKKAAYLNPRMCYYHIDLGRAYLNLRQYEEALRSFEMAKKLDTSGHSEAQGWWQTAWNCLETTR